MTLEVGGNEGCVFLNVILGPVPRDLITSNKVNPLHILGTSPWMTSECVA